MKFSLRARFQTVVLAVLACAAATAPVLAQAVTPPGQTTTPPGQTVTPPGQAKKVDPAVQARDLALYRAGVDNAKTLAKGNNVAGAEQALTALNKTKPNTAAWHIETAQRLMNTAEQLAREAKPAAIPALAASALQHLTQADSLAKDARTRASAKSLAGYIQERYLGNRAAALTAYQSAAQLAPASVKAKESVARLQQTDDNLKAKLPGGGR